jgi:hypothetical protein
LWSAARRLEERGLLVIEGDEALALPIVPDADARRDAAWSERQLLPLVAAPQ